jgi:hypothetical protein
MRKCPDALDATADYAVYEQRRKIVIDFKTIQAGNKVKVVGMGAPGFAKLGDVLEITKVEPSRVFAKREDGEEAFFALTCGASRLELMPNGTLPQRERNGESK